MSARKISGTWYTDFQFNGKRYRKKSPVNTSSGAKVYETRLRIKIANGEEIIGKKVPDVISPYYKDYSWNWFETYAKSNNKESEVSNKEIALRKYLVPFFGNTRIDKISAMQIEEYKAKMIKTSALSNKTINNTLTIFIKSLNSAKDWGEITRVPKVKKLKVAPHRIDFLTEEEISILLNSASGIWRDVILVALKTGMRRGELLALSWEDINWEKSQIVVSKSMNNKIITSTKSNRIRYIQMTSDVYASLLRRKKSKGFVFADDLENHFSIRRLNDGLDQVCRKAGFRKITPHILRHTFASQLAMKGAPIQAIQGLLGHSDIQTTMRYAHLSKSIYQDTMNLLDPKENNNFGQYGVKNKNSAMNFAKVLTTNGLNLC